MVPKSMVFTFRRYLASRSRDKARSVIKTFELQPKLHNQYSPVSQYVKALVKVGKLDEKDFLRNLLKVRIIDSFEVGILPGVKHLLEEAIETTDPKLKYILAVCVVPCILVYMSRSFNIVEKISDKDKYHQNSSIKLRDLKGLDDAKAELRETVDYLNHPEHFRGLGGNYSVGVLLVGPPGTDKTTLARAVAGEAKVHFFSFSGGEYKEAGVEKIKNVFAAAKQMKACVIIFDEIEALGQNERIKERLLLELEGFKEHKETNLIMIGATDQPNLVDQSLLKHGRFDRHVFVSYPDIHGRLQILDSHLLKVPKADDVDVMIIARATLGFSSADLANLVNVAAVRAARDGSTDVSMHHLEYARDQIMMGSECKFALTSEESRKTTAFREGGHALVAMHTYGALPVHKATIVPGMVSQLPDKDQTSHSRKQMLARLD
ncbi:ATP-dependent zinc metalloprotease FTSH 4 mitochondrial-like, partial [Trifolium medium]|nr:ATP-dependent zinc metalloprotease FTSH 4 mitochondrial-like [Trifolium medium]